MKRARKRVLVTGGAGFLGSHLCDRLVQRGDDVLCVDNFYTGTAPESRHEKLPSDDPTQRSPDISQARDLLRWEPQVALQKGLLRPDAPEVRRFRQRVA